MNKQREEMVKAYADRCGIDHTDERAVNGDECGWPERFKDFEAGWQAARKGDSERRAALKGLVEVSEIACMVGMFGYPGKANGPLPIARKALDSWLVGG